MRRNKWKIVNNIIIIILTFNLFTVKTYAVSNSNADEFVKRLYEITLNRQAEQEGLEYWTNSLNTKKIDALTLTWNFFNSQEYLDKKNNDIEFIKDSYKAILGRDADKVGLDYWISQLKAGYTRKYIINNFGQSQEFKDICEDYNINVGLLDLDSFRDNKHFIVDIINYTYTTVLSRTASYSEVDYWGDLISKNNISLADFLKEIINSSEANKMIRDNSQYIDLSYKIYLKRNPTIDEYNKWRYALDNGYSKFNLIFSLINNQEFSDICNSYKISNYSSLDSTIWSNDPKEAEFVINIYNGLLSRSSDQLGLKYWISKLDETNYVGEDLILEFTQMSEFIEKTASNEEYVRVLYRGILFREVDKDSLKWWVNKLSNGEATRDDILQYLLKSEEFINLSKDYKIKIRGKIIKVVVDPGHDYGKDYGAVATYNGVKYEETVLNMQVAVKLKASLEAKGYSVELTRQLWERPVSKDVESSLKARTDFANALNADLFISIHHDSSSASSARGTSTHYSTYKPGIDTEGITTIPKGQSYEGAFIDTTPSPQAVLSRDLANKLVNNVARNLGRINRGAADHNLYVTVNTNMPAVLVEGGFISNPDEAAAVANPENQQKLADTIANTVKEMF